jgi:D-alanyl-D-alanine carboxypeptidase
LADRGSGPGRRRAALFLFAIFVSVAACESQAAPEPLHPRFTLTAPELAELLQQLDPADADRILVRPQVFLELLAQALAGPKELLWLIDKAHPVPTDYVPTDLVALNRYDLSVNRDNHRLRRAMLPDLLAMAEAARAAGRELVISSSYRSFEQQRATYDFWVARDGTAAADRYSAQPGHSQHQLGTAIDFGSIRLDYGDSENGMWVRTNAWRFGFSLSYPDGFEAATGYTYEPWHFRYLGRVGTTLQQEFFGGIQQRLLEFLDRRSSGLRNRLTPPS